MSDIEQAAIDYVHARDTRKRAREARAHAFYQGACTGRMAQIAYGGYVEPLGPCYRTKRPLSEWCAWCQTTQIPHERYRRAADRQAAALRRLVFLVNRSEVTP